MSTRERSGCGLDDQFRVAAAALDDDVAGFFEAMIARLEQPEPVTLDFMLALMRRYMVDDPTYLPLATRCLGLMATQMPTEAAAAFMERMTDRLWAAGSGLERHFPTLPAGGGVVLLPRQPLGALPRRCIGEARRHPLLRLR